MQVSCGSAGEYQEDEQAGVNGHEFGQTPEVGDGQGSLVCCSSWGCKELGQTE